MLRHPQLFTEADPKGVAHLHARRCACGSVFFPPHAYGCEQCGRSGDATSPVVIEAAGVVAAFATVHAHPKLPVPYVLGRVTLDAGPVVDAWMGTDEAALHRGLRVRGVLVAGGLTETGEPLLDLRFVPEAAG